MADKGKAEELKKQGNAATAAGNHQEAVRLYSEAIQADPTNHVLWSNRSAAHASLKQYEAALSDAEKAIEHQPDWSKGYSRKGLALTYLQRHAEAIQAYEEGLRREPGNSLLQQGLQDARAAQQASQSAGPGGAFPNPFADPMLMIKLATNPKTKHLVEDAEFMAKLKMLQANPTMLSSCLQDQRIMLALGALMGVDLQAGPGADDEMRDESPPRPAPDKQESAAAETSSEQRQAKEQKELGNAAYKKKDFNTAIQHYEKALELDPTGMTYLLNLAAVHLEDGQYQKCIDTSLKAVELGRENRADYKLIAKAFSRCALAYSKMQDYQQAKNFYEKSLSEHRTADVKTRLSEVERKLREQKEAAYRDPAKAEEERERGNELFKKGNYPEAIKAYTEAIKRNPDNAKTYSNRAACYTKLASFDLGLKDCDACIKLDPTFIKGHIRKGTLLKGMHQFDRAMEAFQKAIELDENNQEAINGYRECMVSMDNDPDQVKKRALSDPEVQNILSDASMRLILEQMQDNPNAAREHMKNPDIAAKIQKLVQCGLIAFR
ncbi:stress-induced-phosphoprotein 1-like [Pollicipes pollicipes]|uniref:stress-induced-phosphoprotein 1-like n=1 Tax=Pollicipes pollicipes TaxID=41117 RepID=UPI001884B5A2|nr:stress-induced-phosphoprotein 1-like [Pollicipes pollicipes]